MLRKAIAIGLTGISMAALLPLTAATAQGRAGTVLTANQVTGVTLGGANRAQTFRLRLERGGAVIIDLVPVATAAATAHSGDDAMTANTPQIGLTIAGPDGATVRQVGAGAPTAPGVRPNSVEAGVGDSGVRAAVYATAAGDYVVTAHNESDAAAAFELIVRPRRLPAPPTPVAIGTSYDQQATLAPDATGLFQFTTTRPDQMVTIDMTAPHFDTLLELHGPGGGADGAMVAQDDDSGEGTNARIVTTLAEPGRYSIVTRAYTGSGPYRLKVATTDAPHIAPVPVVVGTPIDGHFTGGDAMVLTGDTPRGYQLYSLAGHAGQRVAIAMDAVGREHAQDSEFDPILQVVGDPPIAVDAGSSGGNGLSVIAENDDDVGYNSKVHIRFVHDGTVLIRAGVRNNTDPRGNYRLTVTDEGAR
ncbi:hypothetical protein [Sphingomonas sp.]|uniref:hypothetical protein n=1 Tax=Sphingomonas sp. TaxID=28214 RepID=UPI003CC5F21C